MPHKKIFFPVLLVVAAALAVWTTWSHRAGGFSGLTSGTSTSDGYQALLDAQSAQNARLDRLEAMLGKLAIKVGVADSDAAARRHAIAKGEADTANINPEQMQARQDQEMRKVDAAFAAEPISRKWSARNEKMIESAFSTDSLAAKGAPKPRLYDAQCRSKTCRIEMVYATEAAADEGQLFLLSDIGGALGESRPFERTLPDGSVQLIMYSTATTPRPRTEGH